GDDRDRQDRLQFAAEGAGQGGLAALLAAEVQGQADDDPLDAVLGDQLGDRARLRRFDHRQRGRQGAAGIGQAAAAPPRAVIQGEPPHTPEPSADSAEARPAASASSSFSGSLPPAWAISSRPPPPPPTIGAITSISEAAETPRSTASLETSATR